MRSNKLHDALRRPAFDLADQRGNNPHGTREAVDDEGRRLNGYRYETVQQAERALDPRARRLGETPPPAPPPGGGSSGGGSSGGNGLFWLLAAGAGIALLSALSSSDDENDENDEHDDHEEGDGPSPLLAPPAAPASNITVNLTMPNVPHAPAATVSAPLPNPAPSEPIHLTVPIMAPVVVPPPELPVAAAPAISPAAPLLNPERKKRRRSKVAG